MSRGPRTAPPVAVTVRDGVGALTLARPATRNRLDEGVMAALVEACAAVEDDAAVRVVALAAEGPHFSAGLPSGLGCLPDGWQDGVAALAALTKPVVAGVAGEATGWGLALALAADLRLAAAGAVLRLGDARIGWPGGGGALPRLARLVGPTRAAEMALLERPVSAQEARRWGLVVRVVPGARLRGALDGVARGLAARGPLALALAKETVIRALDLPLHDGLRLEHDCYVLLQTTADRREGIDAFLARRPPRFAGR